MSNVHDNEILKYEVDIEKKCIIFYTKWEMINRKTEYTDIHFIDVLLHYFEDTNFIQNVIFDIEETSPQHLWDLNVHLFEERWRYGGLDFIEIDPKKNAVAAKSDFFKYITKNNLKCYEISSSYGLNGWVIAKDCQIFINSDEKN